MTDPVPTPPPENGLPGRQLPYVPTPFSWAIHPVQLPDGARAFAFLLDSHASRTVTFWAEDELRGFAENALAMVSGGLTIADQADLDRLKDAAPFLEKPGD